MGGISSVLNMASGALIAFQKGIDVTGHNISNVNTPGYTRQSLILEASQVESKNRLKLGMGVLADSVSQAVDRFTVQMIQQRTSALSDAESKKSNLDYIQGLFNDTTDNGLQKSMSAFWNAWQDLADNPGGTPERTALLEKGRTLSEKFRTMRYDLVQARDEMNKNLDLSIEQVNTLTGQIATLNEQIVASEASGTSANDLRDSRNNLVEQLSQLMAVTTVETEGGSLSVMTSKGLSLVDGVYAQAFSRVGDEIRWGGVPRDISDDLSGGKLGAWLDLRDETIPQYIANLDELAGTLMFQVNQQHYRGFAADGSTGLTFFTANPGDDYATSTAAADFTGAAALIDLSADVDGKPAKIAAASNPNQSGNNENALAIQAIQDGKLDIRKWTYSSRGVVTASNTESVTVDDYYNGLVGDIGLLTEETGQNLAFHQTMINQLNEVRDSVSGVSLDEEMINLIKYQHAYAAASRLVTVSDEMLQTLLNIR
jgi:flagellar hook-associated protein 1 FlgK